jgi:hypothetical protein
LQHAYRTHGHVSSDGSVKLENLPFRAGQEVEIIVLADGRSANEERRYPLRGKPVTLIDPTAPVAENDWDALS